MRFSSSISCSLLACVAVVSSETTGAGYSIDYPVVRNIDQPKSVLTSKEEQIFFDTFLSRGTHDKDSISVSMIPVMNKLLEYSMSFQPSPDSAIKKGAWTPDHKPLMIINIVGAELNSEPDFEAKTLQSQFDSMFSKTMLRWGDKLTDAIAVDSMTRGVVDHFQYFAEQTSKIWQSHQDTLKQQIINYSPTNEEMFIRELSSLVHLRDYVKNATLGSDRFYIQISSLASIGNKIGRDSTTYKHAVKSLENVLASLAKECMILVVESPNATVNTHLQKRSKVGLTAPAFKYASKQACEVGTDKCSAHGVCKESKNQWSCVCEPSFNKTTSKTTTWVGPDCGKKDVSVPANLFLWTSIALVLSLVGGVKLLASVGSDPLPGVLDAATLSTKKTI
ncbi:hypothetical protein KGF57_000332 [Candida theae]|uniref:Vacuolar sorting protein Vps3844 C-terminal domain-containing protein n=1 Tax=Candida theae TaxID=1198502 RepID=A0AAD5BJ47_9ASCO|nr:uncharacterized protein KGF57_000332 [Candida theae]KAI5967604.1 hypothetical protein KGF57_000332 [Candida theae]